MKFAIRRMPTLINGFTLLELLITFAISSVLLLGLSQLTGSMLRGWDRAALRIEDQSAVFNAVDKLAEEISGSVPFFIVSSEGGIVSVQTGTSSSMVFVRPAIGFQTSHNLNRVSYSIESNSGKSVIVRRSEILDMSNPMESSGQITRTVLAEFNGSIVFDYSPNGAAFQDSWSQLPVQPKAIRIRFTLDQQSDVEYSKTAFVFSDLGPECLKQNSIFCDQILQQFL